MIQIPDPVETAELLAFTRVVEAKSLSRAAIELGIPRATIGRRLARLEQRLGTRLLRRSTRSLALTEAGELFYRHARIVLEAVAQAEASVRRSDDVMRGDVRLSSLPLNDESFFAMITDFAKQHPEVRVQVDFSTRIVDLRRDGYDVALRAAAEIEPGLVARVVGRHASVAVASPEYLAAMGTPRTAKELRKHRCLTSFARGELPQSEWPVGRGVVHVNGSFSSNDLNLVREAAVRGLGIALLPQFLIADELENGSLVHVLPGVVGTQIRLAVVYLEREFMPPHVRAFVEALVRWAPALERAAGRQSKPTSRSRRARDRAVKK